MTVDVSRWLLPALFYFASLVLLSILQWVQTEALSFEVLLAIVTLNATMAFGVAALLEIAQWLRAHSATARVWWTVAFVAAGAVFSWAVGLELVSAVSFMQVFGYPHVLAVLLGAGVLIALNALRANALGGKTLNLVVSILFLIVFAWVQHRYRMQMREARYAGVSAAFLFLTSVIALRIFERLLPPKPSNPHTFASLLVPLVLLAFFSAFTSEFATKRLYFAGLFPGRFVFALHLPQLLARSERLDPAVAHAAGTPSRRSARSAPLRGPGDLRNEGVASSELVVVVLMDAVRHDTFRHYVERPEAKLRRAWKESCLFNVGYSPASDTAMTLQRMLLRPGTSAEIWLQSIRGAGVSTTLILDSKIMSLLDQRLPTGFSSLFDQALRLQRSAEHPPRFESVAAAVRKTISDQRGQQFVWAHFFEAHEWFTVDRPQGDRESYDHQVAFVADEVADILDYIRSSGRPATVVVIADHGEGIDHFATKTHGGFLYEPLVRVPFMVWTNMHSCSAALGQLRTAPAINTLAVGRLVLDAFGISSDASLPTLGQIAEAPIVMQSGIQDAIVRWPHKLIVSPWFTELYDLRKDPREERNLVSTRPELAAELKDLLDPQH